MQQQRLYRRAEFFVSLAVCAAGFLYGALAAGLLAAVPPAQLAQAQTSIAPDVPLSDTVSRNWAGYVAQGKKKYTAVEGTWTVPVSQAASSSRLEAEATWVGIGGVGNEDLIQSGTQTVIEDGDISYQAWYELLPEYSQSIPLALHGGDSVTVSLSETSPDHWRLAFRNNTTGKEYRTVLEYSSSHSSAEWIEETPLSATARSYIPLSSFGSVSFTDASAVADGVRVSPAAANAEPLRMGLSASQILAAPTALAENGAGFSIQRSDVSVAAAVPPRRRSVAVYRDDLGIIYIAVPNGGGGYTVRVLMPPGMLDGSFIDGR